jgi:hypothetical protein
VFIEKCDILIILQSEDNIKDLKNDIKKNT